MNILLLLEFVTTSDDMLLSPVSAAALFKKIIKDLTHPQSKTTKKEAERLLITKTR